MPARKLPPPKDGKSVGLMIHWLDIIDLTLNAVGALLLILYPPGSSTWDASGGVTTKFRERWRVGAYVALFMLVAGFVLQLIAAIISP